MDYNDKIEFIIKTVLHYYPTVQGIYLFGSYLTEDEWKDSDVDIALLLPHELAKREGALAVSECRHALEDELEKPVDLLNARLVSTVMQMQIVTTGRLLYTGDEYTVQEFEMLTFSYYQKLNEERREILEAFQATGRAYDV